MLDSNVSTYIDKDGNVQEVGSGGLSFPISYTGTATDAKIDLITDYEGNREKYTTITPSSVVVGNGMSSSKLEISSSDNSESTYIRFSPNGGSSVELYANSGDGDGGAVLTIEGKPILASSNVNPEYANTSEIVDNAITLTSTSTLADLATQILAHKTKVCRVSYGKNTMGTLARLYELFNMSNAYSAPSYTFEYFFKVLSSDDYIELECLGGGAAAFFRGGITRYYNGASEPPYGDWEAIPLIQYANPYPIGSIYQSTSSTSPSSLFGGTWEQIKDVFLLAAGDTYPAGSTGGEATHTLTLSEMPAHIHNTYVSVSNSPGPFRGVLSGSEAFATNKAAYEGNDSTVAGANGEHNNMPPYLAVCVWKRIA